MAIFLGTGIRFTTLGAESTEARAFFVKMETLLLQFPFGCRAKDLNKMKTVTCLLISERCRLPGATDLKHTEHLAPQQLTPNSN